MCDKLFFSPCHAPPKIAFFFFHLQMPTVLPPHHLFFGVYLFSTRRK